MARTEHPAVPATDAFRRAPWLIAVCSLLALASGERAAADPAARGTPAAPAYELPPVDVRGTRLTLAELIDRAARAVEASRNLDVPCRYTRRIRFVAAFGEPGRPGRKRQVYEEISRVVIERGGRVREVKLLEREETWRGDSLTTGKTDEKSGVRIRAQVENLEGLPFAVRGGDYRYAILERRPMGDRALLRVAYTPAGEFVPVPEGEAWLDSRNYIVLRQTGAMHRNVFLPMMIKDIEWFRLGRKAYGPLWLVDDFVIRIRLRKLPKMPDRIEVRIRIYDVALGQTDEDQMPAGGAVGADTAVFAVLDSLAALEDAAADSLLDRPAPAGLSQLALRGDSLLAAKGGSREFRVVGVRPELRYDRAERLYLGMVGTAEAGTPFRRISLGGGVAFGMGRPLGSLALDLGPSHWGFRLAAGDGVETMGARPETFQALTTAAGFRDPAQYYRRLDARAGPWISLAPGEEEKLTVYARAGEDRALRSRSLWTLTGTVRDQPLQPIDPGRIRAAGSTLVFGGTRMPLRAVVRLNAELAGSRLGGTLPYRMVGGEVAIASLLPGAMRLRVRLRGLSGSERLPRQEWMYLGGVWTLRGYPERTLAGRQGLHLGGELHLNRDIAGWLPRVPDRGLGLEAFVAGDFGVIAAPGADHAGLGERRRSSRASLGLGCSRPMGLPGFSEIRAGIYAGVGRGDRAWQFRFDAI